MIFMFILFLIFRIIDMVVWTIYPMRYEKILAYIAGITGVIFLVVLASSIIAVSVFLAKSSTAAWKEQLGTFFILLVFPIFMILFPGVFWIIHLRRMRRGVQLRGILVIMFDFMYNHKLFNMLFLIIYSQLFTWISNTFKLEYSIPIAVAALGICACIIIKDYLLYREEKRLEGFYYFAQKVLLGIYFILHLMLSCLYLSVILENDKGRPVKICEFVFIYILSVTFLFRFWIRQDLLAKPRKYVYFSGTFALPLVNSVALAVALKLKADTGKQSQGLRLTVLISGSVFLFSCFVIEMSAYWLAKNQKPSTNGDLKERALTRSSDIKLFQPQRNQSYYDEESQGALQQPIPPTTIPGPLADLGKHKLIREQLLLLLHARMCQQHKQTNREEWSCSRPQCRTMRKVLKHMDSCQAGMSCQVKHCTSSCKLISHWDNCTQHDCPVCMPHEDFSNQRSDIDDLEKLELIQAQLLLLLHAQECQQRKQANEEEWSCTKPQCYNMRKVLKHMDSCQADMTCQEHLCTFSRQLISHWEFCTQDDCLTLHFTKTK
nr:uncharacterized protein LOC111841526 [Paramormyrops kingsleyae]